MTTSAPESVLDVISDLLVEKFEVPSEEVRASAPMSDLLIDSLMIVEMAIAVHETLGVKVGEDELRAATLAEFAASVDERLTDR
ncbi:MULTISPECIES: acyl carrier protein [unclassified Streptomyces]|uniref:acyl carrier protein n=1 Tax=unclassified Streptomyces TaxID=2593676 RepID=UPI002E0D1430|nr:acyl carrier protein [Streptomyces sp. NBC_01343]